MRPRLLVPLAPPIALPAALLAALPVRAAERTGRPLLELEGRGTRVTNLSIPFCGAGCLGRDPRFVSYRLLVLRDGRVSTTLSENRLGNPDAAVARIVDGRGPEAAFAALREQLEAARIGQASAQVCAKPLRELVQRAIDYALAAADAAAVDADASGVPAPPSPCSFRPTLGGGPRVPIPVRLLCPPAGLSARRRRANRPPADRSPR